MTIVLNGTTGITDVNGTAAAPALTGTDTDTGIFFPAANTLAFSTNGTEDARFDASGNFGLGVTPSAWSASGVLQVSRASMYSSGGFTAFANNWYSNAGDKYIASDFATQYYQSSGQHVWRTAASGTAGNAITFTQAMTLDASGNLGVGNTSPSQKVSIGFTAGTVGYNIVYTGGGGGEVAAFTANGSTGEVRIGGTGSTYFPTFYSNGAERARIDSSGNLLVGTTSFAAASDSSNPASGGGLGLVGATSGSVLNLKLAGGNGTLVNFARGGVGVVGSISVTTTATAYNTSSDYRLKDITGGLTGYKERLLALEPKQGSWKVDGSEFRGFLAHEFANSYPSSVNGEKDAVDAEGNPQYQGMQAGSPEVIADLVAYIKELETRLAALEQA